MSEISQQMYFFAQATPTSAWEPHPAAERERVLRELAPTLVTVLDVGNRFDKDMTPDEHKAVKHRGPWYADFDGETIADAIHAFKALLAKLQSLGLELNQVRLFATGGRGFHVEVPAECFVPGGLPVDGVIGLPHIYREMAHELYVDLMDMRVYSGRRGRMWRCPNRQRDNGLFKVGITPTEALGMTVEMYTDLCSAPRAFPDLAAPRFCAALGLLFARASDKVGRSKPRKSSGGALRHRFGATLPPTIAALCEGRIPARAGWNIVALQLGTLADELGIDENTLVEKCQGLIKAHDSDGSRYNTPAKREAELRRMFGYVSGNVCYSASVAGLRSILPKGLRVNDFRGLE